VGGSAAGIALRRLREPNRQARQLSGLTNGFFVPISFVLLDLRRLATDPAGLALAGATAAASVCVRLAGAGLAGRGRRVAGGRLASALSPAVAAALVACGCVTLVPASIGAALPGPAIGPSRRAGGSGGQGGGGRNSSSP
jgi:hypothetical protein